jgi:hypothetical protein
MPIEHALITAVYTVEEVKKVDAFCGGPTRAAVLGVDKVVYSEQSAHPTVAAVLKGLERYEDEFKKNWQDWLKTMVKKIEQAYSEFKKTP